MAVTTTKGPTTRHPHYAHGETKWARVVGSAGADATVVETRPVILRGVYNNNETGTTDVHIYDAAATGSTREVATIDGNGGRSTKFHGAGLSLDNGLALLFDAAGDITLFYEGGGDTATALWS